MVTDTAQLPLKASTELELMLTDDQAELFGGLRDLQRLHRGSVIFSVLASSYEPKFDAGRLRLQCKLIDQRIAAKVVKLVRQAELSENSNSNIADGQEKRV